MQALVIATHNRHKTEEIRAILGPYFSEISDLNDHSDIPPADETQLDSLNQRIAAIDGLAHANPLWLGRLLANDHVIARAIVTNSSAEMTKVEELLAQGADFETVAAEKSIDPSRERGGLLPPITRGAHRLARLAFVTPVGDLGGPIEEQGRYMLIRVEERPRPRDGNWAEVGTAVERSLDQRPVDPMEWLQWEEAMYARYGVDTKPFLDLVGEPTER